MKNKFYIKKNLNKIYNIYHDLKIYKFSLLRSPTWFFKKYLYYMK